MSKADDDSPAALLAQAEELAEKAVELTQAGKVGAAANKLGRAVALAEKSGDFAEYSRYLYTQALMLSQLPQERARAEELWRKAAAAADLAARRDLQVKALQRIAALHAGEGDLEGAISHFTVLLEMMGKHQETRQSPERVAALRDRARLYAQRGLTESNRIFVDRAHSDLSEAADLARALYLQDLQLEIRLELRSLEAVMPDRAGKMETFAALRAEAETLGNRAILGSLGIEQAMSDIRGGRHEKALEYAESARQAALDTPDPVRYLIACMLIAEAREHLGDRAGVIAILLTCKASLEKLLGQAAGQQVKLVLDSLENRWGHDGVAAALSEYRQRMASQPA